MAFLGISETLFPVAGSIARTPNAMFHACSPTDEDMEKIEQMSTMWAWSFTAPRTRVRGWPELALADGRKIAVVIPAGASGDYAHDRRIIGFTETLRPGGEILFVSPLRRSLRGRTEDQSLR